MTSPLTSDQRRAFLSAHDPQRYYAASAIEEARQRIVRAIARSEGPALVVGAVGTGKSLLLAVLAEQFEPRMSVVTLPGAQLCTRRALLQMILGELHLPYRHMDEGELRLSILEHLRGPASSDAKVQEPSPPGRGQGEGASRTTQPRPRRMLVLVDEADALPTRLLEELRVLTNVVSHGIPLVSLVLAGSPILEERFADPQLDMFSQRLACRCYLAPLTREETFQYVRSQVSAVGVRPETWFDPDALAAIHAATGGVPRVVNQLGDQLVWLIEETGCQPLDAALVQQAWSDLQQLPAPWNTDAHSSFSSPAAASVGAFDGGALDGSVVEFGELDNDPPTSRSVRAPGAEDAAIELFRADAPSALPSRRDRDDDGPASIPIGAGRSRRNADLTEYAAAIDATEDLVEQLDEFDILELADDDAPMQGPETSEPTAPAAANPFDEPFAEEEILVDPYSGFESQMLRTARQVINRIDRTFAAELARCELRKSKLVTVPGVSETTEASASPNSSAKKPATEPPRESIPIRNQKSEIGNLDPALAPTRAPLAPPAGNVLIIEDDQQPAATIVPGRQFRRLFSSLESTAGGRASHG
jgi:type II secretory pathway predicted ATPase ExeA